MASNNQEIIVCFTENVDLLEDIQVNAFVKEYPDLKKLNLPVDRITYLENMIKLEENYENQSEDVIDKCDKFAVEFREIGNVNFQGKKFGDALSFYNKSLCVATKSGGNLALAYASKYNNCIIIITSLMILIHRPFCRVLRTKNVQKCIEQHCIGTGK
jgi:hypothetical protein